MAEMRAETRYAKQLFLYGAGDGQPVRNVARLEELSGVTGETIRKHLPEWEKEAAELLASSSEIGLAICLSAEKLQLHESDMIHLRDQLQQVKWELEQMDTITERLAEWLDNFDNDERDKALRILEDWLNASARKANLRSQFLALQKQWTALSGIVDLKDIQVTREKEIAKGKAKLEVSKMGAADLTNTPRKVGGGVFDRNPGIGNS